MESGKVDMKRIMELDEVIAYLEDLKTAFGAGKIVVEDEGRFVTLIPPDQVGVEVEAKSKEGKQKFSLELSWKTPAGDEKPKLRIGSEEPEEEEEGEGGEDEEKGKEGSSW